MRKRDAAYHQGTIWPWLCGAYAQAICNHGNSGLRDTLEEFENLVRPQRGALLSVCEVYNPADLSPAGCPSQAWSVAETIRGYVYLLEALEQHRDLKLLEARDERVLG